MVPVRRSPVNPIDYTELIRIETIKFSWLQRLGCFLFDILYAIGLWD